MSSYGSSGSMNLRLFFDSGRFDSKIIGVEGLDSIKRSSFGLLGSSSKGGFSVDLLNIDLL